MQRFPDALGGVMRYEFVMQVRRLPLWIVSAVLGIIPLIQFNSTGNYTHDANLPVTRTNIVVIEAAGAAGIFVLGAGLLLADRLRRDRTTRVEDLLRTAPASNFARLAGKYLGSTLALLVPLTLVYLIGFACLVIHWQDASILPLALAGYVAFVVPAVLFVAAFSIACTAVLWPPLFQFLFIGYWLWDSLDPKGPGPHARRHRALALRAAGDDRPLPLRTLLHQRPLVLSPGWRLARPGQRRRPARRRRAGAGRRLGLSDLEGQP